MSENNDDDVMALFLQDVLQVPAVTVSEPLQALWGGQGSLVRVSSSSIKHPTAVLKIIRQNRQADHPRGWNSDASFARKARSYVVECCWYERYSNLCNAHCKVPDTLGVHVSATQRLILLEDLSIHYPARCSHLGVDQVHVCLAWLAHFHAQFMHSTADDLWEEGTYWHLGTRQDEYTAMEDGRIKRAAVALDARLRNARYQSLVHGDAKVANFCFSEDMEQVAAVDFQYVGRGCGIRDVAYLLGSCLSESDCSEHEQALLDSYFTALNSALRVNTSDDLCRDIENEWRDLYDIAWTDFYRFLLGWMPSHSKINGYTLCLADRALEKLPI